MVKKFASIVFIACLSLTVMNFACNRNQEIKAAQLADSLAHSIVAFHNAINVAHKTCVQVDTTHKNCLIDETDYRIILNDLLTVDEAGLNINSAIRGISNGTSTLAQFNAAVTSLENALVDGTAHIKDPNTLAEVKAAVAAINTVVISIESFYPAK